MLTDLTHNKIIRDTITDEFIKNVNSVLVPIAEGVFGESAITLQMYEDHLSDGFKKDGRWCYPFTVLTDDGARTLWVSWTVDKKHFAGGVPYSYVGEAPMDFELMHSVPPEFSDKLVGRSIYATSDGYLKVRLQTVSEDPLFLSGKYSQTFIDEMAKQLTDAVCTAMSVSGLNTSCLSLQMLFTPETYMEHTSENVTYRRLRLTDRTSAPRDFWIKWTRTNSAAAYSVSDAPAPGTVRFELGEDVPQKIREREYRFLLETDADKYQSSMSRKNITEWRELIKRAVKRGELEKVELGKFGADSSDDLLSAMLADVVPDKKAPTDEIPETNADDALQNALKSILEDPAVEYEPDEEPDTGEDGFDQDAAAPEVADTDAPGGEVPDEDEADTEDTAEEKEYEEYEEDEENGEEEPPFDYTEEDSAGDDGDGSIAEIKNDIADVKNVLKIEENKEKDDEKPLVDEMKEKMMRAEIEAKVRLEYESIARIKAEKEAKRLLEEQEKLRRENERLVAEAKRTEQARAREEAERKEREDRLKAEIEAKVRAEAREKERLAEAAMLAIEEKRRLEAEKAEQMRLAAEKERIKEAERRAEVERQRLEEQRRVEAERIRKEAEERAAAEKAARQVPAPQADAKQKYVFVSKKVTFFFRNHIDPNITDSMEEIIRKTLEKLSKTDVPINIKASVVDEMTVCLDFVKIPADEEELLIKIVQALGNGNIGISKAKVEQ